MRLRRVPTRGTPTCDVYAMNRNDEKSNNFPHLHSITPRLHNFFLMSHPHKALLDEFQFAIHHFASTLPDEIKTKAQKIHDDLLSDESANESSIKLAFHDVGIQEYPYRHAYEELIQTKEEGKLNDLVLEHVDAPVRAVIEPHLKSGVHLDELMHSDLLSENLTPEQIYQIEDGVNVAKSKLGESIKKHVSDDAASYESLLTKWTNRAKEIEAKIAELKAFAEKGDEGQKLEILNRVQYFREGFLLTEIDPDLEEIQQEINYWNETFAEMV